MNFTLWLLKRAWKPIVRKWNLPATEDKFSGKIELALKVVLIGWLLSMCIAVIVDWIAGTAFTTLIVIAIGLIGLLGIILVACMCDACKYIAKLYDQYRAEQPEQGKPKRKHKQNGQVIDDTEYFTPEVQTRICDGCAKQTNDLTAVPIAGIGISHQCPKCTPIIEEYERRYQKGKANDQR